MLNLIAQFIPILLIFFLIAYSKSFIKFSNSILGKLIVIGIIMFYTYLDKILGLFVCLLFIFFYQTDIFENMLNMDIDLADIDYRLNYTTEEQIQLIDDYQFLTTDKKKRENLINYVELNSADFNKDILLKTDNLKDNF